MLHLGFNQAFYFSQFAIASRVHGLGLFQQKLELGTIITDCFQPFRKFEVC